MTIYFLFTAAVILNLLGCFSCIMVGYSAAKAGVNPHGEPLPRREAIKLFRVIFIVSLILFFASIALFAAAVA